MALVQRHRAASVIAAAAALCAPAAQGATRHVPGDFPTIQAAVDAAAEGDEVVVADGLYAGPGNREIAFGGKRITVRSSGGPGACTIDCEDAGRAFVLTAGETVETVIEGFTIVNGYSDNEGGAVRFDQSGVTIRRCTFSHNYAVIGGAVGGHGDLVLIDCTFDDNACEVGAGAVSAFEGSLVVVGCDFVDNDGAAGPGALVASGVYSRYANCVFRSNEATFIGGGLVDGGSDVELVNSVFSRNTAPKGGGVTAAGQMRLFNCTFSGNSTDGLVSAGAPVELTNCILWNNASGSIGGSNVTVTWSTVEGGWPGAGNFDENPIFVQPGTDDLRLAAGSPCLETGLLSGLPADELDLDGDGDTDEPIPVDADGEPRVQDSGVDRGAYEGAFPLGDPAAATDDLDEGESVVLVPTAGGFDPVEATAVVMVNVAGGDDASAIAAEVDWELHPDAGGYTEDADIVAFETSLGGGLFYSTVFIPFTVTDPGDVGQPNGTDPLLARLTRYDPGSGTWALAVASNTVDSPGHDGPVGDRIFSTDPDNQGVTNQLGDYGIYLDAAADRGFAWANVDHAGDFAVGVAPCIADCGQPPDGSVDIVDLLAALLAWGSAAGGPCDVDLDGVIGWGDFVAVLDAWGPCPAPVAPPPPAGDVRAYLRMLAEWRPSTE